MNPSYEISIRDNKDGSIRLYTPYNHNFVRALKWTVPYGSRTPIYKDKKFQYWLVDKAFYKACLSLMRKFWSDLFIYDEIKDASKDLEWVKELFDSVPEDKEESLYRSLTKVFHPDVSPGVNENVIKKINAIHKRKEG